MKLDLSFFRFVIIFSIAKTGLWKKNNDVFILHIGTFSNETDTAVRVILFPFSLMLGFIRKEQEK
jgi:hypothetical protein